MAATFHEGEVALQERAGSRAKLADIGPRVIRDYMPDQHREFFAQLPFVLAGTVDAQGQPWASVLAGDAGFVTSPHPRRLAVRARPLAQDPLAGNLVPGAAIGLLGIEPHTRRRNRLNGWVVVRDEGGFEVQVGQSFGNCPKYIQARRPQFTGAAGEPPPAQVLDTLDPAARKLIAQADTFFIATAHPQSGRGDAPAFGVDVSHRGGKPGFVRVVGNVLIVPDFAGNAFFNTLGNLAVNPRCGLLFIDFDTGDLLQVAARGEIIHDGPEVQAFHGAQRLMRLHVGSALRLPMALPLRWGEAELSPVLEATGAWQ
jgi:predicted pyridoxine 5'-phosphate oxidase superfamily flavin-nucleotide-binding protein